MSLTIHTALLLIAAVIMVLSAFVRPQDRVDLFKLAWGLVVLSLVIA